MIPEGEADYLVVFAEDQVPVNIAFHPQEGGVLPSPQRDIDVSRPPSEKR